jgi:hypothetical protein
VSRSASPEKRMICAVSSLSTILSDAFAALGGENDCAVLI